MTSCGISSFYNLPWVNGLLALVFLGLTAVVITELFSIRKPLAAALAGAVLASFPAVTGTFVFVYTIDGYMIALFLSCLAVLLAVKVRWGFAPAILLGPDACVRIRRGGLRRWGRHSPALPSFRVPGWGLGHEGFTHMHSLGHLGNKIIPRINRWF